MPLDSTPNIKQIAAKALWDELNEFYRAHKSSLENKYHQGTKDQQRLAVNTYNQLQKTFTDLVSGKEESAFFKIIEDLKKLMATDNQWAPFVIKACELDPYPFSVTHLAWGDAYLELDQPEEAREKFETALCNDSLNLIQAEGHLGLAKSYLQLKEYNEAKKHAEKALEIQEAEGYNGVKKINGIFNLESWTNKIAVQAASVLEEIKTKQTQPDRAWDTLSRPRNPTRH